MTDPIDSKDGVPRKDIRRPSPSLVETGTDQKPEAHPRGPAPGTDAARNEERKTPPSRNRGVTEI